jgi:alkylation response protein AidB-like acyl-CoA dehydrogenase
MPGAQGTPILARQLSDATEALHEGTVIARFCAEHAPQLDRDDAFPEEEFRRIAEAGLLAAPLPRVLGGLGLGTEPEGMLPGLQLLTLFGWGNLAVGRIYEGHVNALQLIALFGTPEQRERYAADAREGKLFAVWNTEHAAGVKLEPRAEGGVRLHGAKLYTSGAGWVERALVPGALPDGGWQICVVPMAEVATSIDRSVWRPLGMRASASYLTDFTGVELGAEAALGVPGSYHRQPWFSGGAVRFAAVQLGGAAALLDAARAELRALGRVDDPFQRARIGEAAALIAGGQGWLRATAALLDTSPAAFQAAPPPPPETIARVVAHANLTRTAIAEGCVRVIEIVERSIGMRGLLRPHPIERIGRDLTLYLRQPAPDAAIAGAGAYVLGDPRPILELWNAER